MQKHLINYDLSNPGQNYDDLIAAIKAYDVWAYICKSCWAVKSDKTDGQIRDDLCKHIDSNDKLFVCAFDGWASSNLSKEVVDWLKNK